jgi:hypothetical protein
VVAIFMSQDRPQQPKAKTAAAKRKEAARARRLALSVSEPNRPPLLEYADELEAEADALERAVTGVTRKQDQGQQQKAERRETSVAVPLGTATRRPLKSGKRSTRPSS